MIAAKWAIECRSNNQLDGVQRGLLSSGLADEPAHPLYLPADAKLIALSGEEYG